MSNYSKITDYAAKDLLLHGDAAKAIKGTEVGAEFDAIATMSATKVDSGGALGTPSSGTLTNCTGLPVSGITDSTTETLGVGSIELGHATDTTITRTGAGAIAVEGVAVLLSGGALGTPSGGTLTNCAGLPLAGVVDSTTEALGVGSLEVGHASDTTITRVSAGTIAVEGVNVLTTSTGAAIAGSASQVFSVSAPTAAAHAARWDTPNMASLTVTQAGGALTFAGIAHPLTFRSATLTNGSVSTIIADPADLVLPSGGTLGFTTTVQGRIVVAEMNNGGTSEYAICNIAGGLQMDETNLISTTAIDTASDSANVWYSTTARTSLPYKIVGAVDVVNTAGAWGNPVLVQASGGNAITSMSSLGYGQTWQDVAASRDLATTYYNTTGKPIFVNFRGSAAGDNFTATVGGATADFGYAPAGAGGFLHFIVPPSTSYSVTSPTGTKVSWYELR